MRPDKGPYLPTSRACAHVRPHAVPAVVLSPLRAALDRSCPSSPYLRLLSPPPAASHLRLLLFVLTQYPPFSSLPSTDLRYSSCHSLAPFLASTKPASARGTRPIRRHPHTRPLCPSLSIVFVARPSAKVEEGGGVWNPLSALGLLSAGENVQRREEEGGEYRRQVSGKYGTASTGV
jgi:hypothetical protein